MKFKNLTPKNACADPGGGGGGGGGAGNYHTGRMEHESFTSKCSDFFSV